MADNVLFIAKQYMKSYMNLSYLPRIYDRYCKNSTVNYNKVIFADAHSDRLTANMLPIYKRLSEQGYDIKNMCIDTSKLSTMELMKYMKTFMKEYATARYVFLSSYFLPAASCNKRKETKVIELWHAGGMLKKMGYDAKDDIPSYFKGNPAANFDLVTVSADFCIPAYESAFRLDKGVAAATGIARTDLYYDDEFNKKCVDRFYNMYPNAIGKKICLFAPSFSGNAARPVCRSYTPEITKCFDRLSDEWFFVTKLHPHVEKKYPGVSCPLNTEELYAPCDLLITDYSSVVFDFMIYNKPFILYAPDIKRYMKERGFYIEISMLPAPVVKTAEGLEKLMRSDNWKRDPAEIEKCRGIYMEKCDGHAVDRILKTVGIDVKET
ncbi:MAG: CDP-glycerol glycerophosphotransferase family protein [Eubacterium sp.]|nr:CDP-glycerol glycerophosphotransferase family protein [Eubacterium sp.]